MRQATTPLFPSLPLNQAPPNHATSHNPLRSQSQLSIRIRIEHPHTDLTQPTLIPAGECYRAVTGKEVSVFGGF